MFKRTKGYFLLTMLVLTGLAGTIHSTILTTKERHTLATQLKTSRNDFLKATEELSIKQLNFKADKNHQSIKEYIFELVSLENNLWVLAQTSLKQEISLERRTFSDQTLASVINQKEDFQFNNLKFKTVKEALKFYKTERAEMLRYVQTSTENVRGHIAKTEVGVFDVYQLMLLNTFYCNYYLQQIEQIKTGTGFPE